MKKLIALFLTTIVLGNITPSYGELIYPDPQDGINSAQYGDFYSYSLPITAYQYDLIFGGGTGPGNPFYIDSSPGKIKDDIVVATGASGTPVNTNYAGMDNAYSTPNSNGVPTFNTQTFVDPGGAGEFTGDSAGTWDARVSSILNFLGGNELFFYFNNNEENSGSTINQTLLAAAQIVLRSDDGSNIAYFDFLNDGGDGPGTAPDFGADADVTDYDNGGRGEITTFNANDYAISGGQICTNATATAIVACNDPGAVVFNHNLGADQAAYALYSPELMDALRSGLYDYMSINISLDSLTNGYEQIFIRGATLSDTFEEVPSPSSLTLLLSICGLILFRAKRYA